MPWSDWERHVWSVFDQGNGNLYRGQKNGGTPPWFFAMDDMWTLFDLIRSFWFFCSHHLVSILFRKEYLLHPSSDFFQMGRNCRNQSLIIIIFLQFWSEHHHLKQKSGWIGAIPDNSGKCFRWITVSFIHFSQMFLLGFLFWGDTSSVSYVCKQRQFGISQWATWAQSWPQRPKQFPYPLGVKFR